MGVCDPTSSTRTVFSVSNPQTGLQLIPYEQCKSTFWGLSQACPGYGGYSKTPTLFYAATATPCLASSVTSQVPVNYYTPTPPQSPCTDGDTSCDSGAKSWWKCDHSNYVYMGAVPIGSACVSGRIVSRG